MLDRDASFAHPGREQQVLDQLDSRVSRRRNQPHPCVVQANSVDEFPCELSQRCHPCAECVRVGTQSIIGANRVDPTTHRTCLGSVCAAHEVHVGSFCSEAVHRFLEQHVDTFVQNPHHAGALLRWCASHERELSQVVLQTHAADPVAVSPGRRGEASDPPLRLQSALLQRPRSFGTEPPGNRAHHIVGYVHHHAAVTTAGARHGRAAHCPAALLEAK